MSGSRLHAQRASTDRAVRARVRGARRAQRRPSPRWRRAMPAEPSGGVQPLALASRVEVLVLVSVVGERGASSSVAASRASAASRVKLTAIEVLGGKLTG